MFLNKIKCNQIYRSFISKTKRNRCLLARVVHRSTTSVSSLPNGPDLHHFLSNSQSNGKPFVVKRDSNIPYINPNDLNGNGAKVMIKTYGCQMNVNDTDIAKSILSENGYQLVDHLNEAEIVFLMTCAIRENAETKVWNKLKELAKKKKSGQIKQIGVLGCIAERLKTDILTKNKSVDIVAGPDTYRDLPKLLAINRLTADNAVNVLLSLDETYSDVMPTINKTAVTAFVSIMRGCDNMCSYCIVPFTRGKERSRPIDSIVNEVRNLSQMGIKEVTLLGQNVNSYRDSSKPIDSEISLVPGFKTVYKPKTGGLTFDVLLEEVAKVDPNMRIRFTSPHPKDFDDRVLEVIQRNDNICKCIHLPVQSGSNEVLQRMRRGYTREAYFSLVDRIHDILPDCALSSDFICGFCGETDADHKLTLDLIERVKYNSAFIFAYSMRQKTHAFHKLSDDVPQELKISRLDQINQLYRKIAFEFNKSLIGSHQLILIEGISKKDSQHWFGRNEANLKVIVPEVSIPSDGITDSNKTIAPGDYVVVRIEDCSAITLMAEPLYHSTLSDYYQNRRSRYALNS